MATITDGVLAHERTGSWFQRILIAVVALATAVLIYYIGGAAYLHHVDDDPEFGGDVQIAEGSSKSVAVVADLINREVNLNRWVANDPPFIPSYLLDNMPAFQTGLMTAVGRYTVELRDRIARVRGSSAVDPDLESAAGRLNYPGDVWIFAWSGNPVQPSSESQYRRGIKDLRRYNDRLGQGSAVFERRADNFMATLDRISDDLGGAMAALSREVDYGTTSFLDFNADNLFYNTKGKFYAYYLILRALGQDFDNVIRERNLDVAYQEMLHSARLGAMLHPWIVSNGPLDSQAVPNHLAAQGFYLLRTRTKLEEIIDILLT